MSDGPRSTYTITFEGVVYEEGDLVNLALSKALEVAGCAHTHLHPVNGPDHFVAVLAAFLYQNGEPWDAALARVAELRWFDCWQMIGVPDGSR